MSTASLIISRIADHKKTAGSTVAIAAGLAFAATPAHAAAPADARAIAHQMIPDQAQYQCFSNIVERESDWDVTATNPSSGAFGLVQALPGSKMASAGPDWRTNPATQIKWGLDYMKSAYGGPCGAWAFWQSHGWY